MEGRRIVFSGKIVDPSVKYSEVKKTCGPEPCESDCHKTANDTCSACGSAICICEPK